MRVRVLCLLFLLCAPSGSRAERIWLEIDAPRAGAIVREPIGMLEIRGWAGSGLRGAHDVVLVIDRSAGTLLPSGADVDGDGEIGEIVSDVQDGRIVQRMTDPGDSVAQAQLVAARKLVERLDQDTTRMGIVTFGRTERVRARIGTPRDELLRTLDLLPTRAELGGTYFYGAIIASIQVFETAPAAQGSAPRHRSMIFLSDGLPNEPAPRSFAEKAAVRAASHAADARVRIYSFALGPQVARSPDVFRRMARANGGELLLVEKPGEIIDYVPHISLTKLRDVAIENLSTGSAGRAVRLFPDGSFDGYAPLRSGSNRLRITVRGEGGGTSTLEREVSFEPTPDDARLAALLEAMRARTIETELAEEARRKRDRLLRKQLEIELEQP